MMVTAEGDSAIVGVAEHGNSAELVTVRRRGALLDRRRVDLTDPGTPTHPYHHQGAWAVGRYLDSPWAKPISLPDAIALIERVEKAAGAGAVRILDAVQADVPVPVSHIAIRACPELPDGIEARIRDNRAQTMADSVMYRMALAHAAKARGWTVCWYDRDTVFAAAAAASGIDDIAPVLKTMGRAAGAPWQARHKLAAAAALAV